MLTVVNQGWKARLSLEDGVEVGHSDVLGHARDVAQPEQEEAPAGGEVDEALPGRSKVCQKATCATETGAETDVETLARGTRVCSGAVVLQAGTACLCLSAQIKEMEPPPSAHYPERVRRG